MVLRLSRAGRNTVAQLLPGSVAGVIKRQAAASRASLPRSWRLLLGISFHCEASETTVEQYLRALYFCSIPKALWPMRQALSRIACECMTQPVCCVPSVASSGVRSQWFSVTSMFRVGVSVEASGSCDPVAASTSTQDVVAARWTIRYGVLSMFVQPMANPKTRWLRLGIWISVYPLNVAEILQLLWQGSVGRIQCTRV